MYFPGSASAKFTMKFARTRIKFCGLTRAEDVDTAVALGVDALGFVFYPASPRYLTTERAAQLVARVPPFVTTVGLFVDAPREQINAILDRVALQLLQFQGDEAENTCAGFRVRHMKAARVTPQIDLLEFERLHRDASLLMLDAHSEGYGGAGKVFDWSLIPNQLIGPDAARRVVLSGGLNAQNVADAIARVRPYAVDVSSGIEHAKGIKDPDAMRRFVAAVRSADEQLSYSDSSS